MNRAMASPDPAVRQSAEEVLRLIRTAIVEKHPLRVIYDGRERWLCPQMLGRNREGRTRVLCLQVGGGSVSGLRHENGQGDWRCLSLEKFSGVERVEGVWQTAGSSVGRPKCIDQIELEVSSESP
jgi:hypothetical protein